jgi:hypothetical protein
LNIYRTSFFAKCPNNGSRILYSLEIKTAEVVSVEEIIEVVEGIDEEFHEAIADQLLKRFGGKQTLSAEHHGVHIESHRA